MNKNNIQLNNSFDNLKILIVGDVILDHYLIGKVDRISPEAPVPVVLHEIEDYRLGGAANVALNIRSMGARPFLVSLIGADYYGNKLQDLLKQEQIDTAYLLKDTSRKTTCKTRILARNQHLIRYDHESVHFINDALQNQILSSIKKIIAEESIDVIILQDYNKGLLTNYLIDSILSCAQQNNITTLADPKKSNFLAYKGVDYFKPNLREINEGLQLSISETDPDVLSLDNASNKIHHHLNNHCTLITLGAKGMYYQLPHEAGIISTKERQITDVCGAGDTVISILALGVAAKMNIQDIIKLANIAGGQVCEKVGVVSVDKSNLLEEYYKQ
ncbi:bifunctional ADP-heptose synthase [Aureispira]|nr:bifunctional ADP-heptose synthase [Aureispira sp.]